MINEAPGPIDFNAMLTMFGNRLNGTDEESILMNSFKLFDPSNKGIVNKDEYG